MTSLIIKWAVLVLFLGIIMAVLYLYLRHLMNKVNIHNLNNEIDNLKKSIDKHLITESEQKKQIVDYVSAIDEKNRLLHGLRIDNEKLQSRIVINEHNIQIRDDALRQLNRELEKTQKGSQEVKALVKVIEFPKTRRKG